MKNRVTSFAYITTRFFQVYLPGERGYSEATIASYLDTFKQLLVYCKENLGKSPDKLVVSDISKDVILGFLKKLEDDGRSVSTRNQRLAAIKCFFRYIGYSFPEYLDTSSMIVGIKMKKQPKPIVSYMSVDGVSCVLNQPDMNRRSGYRDALMLTILYDCAARVTEITKIRIGDIRTEHPSTIVLHGKSAKDRIVPLSSKTADLISSYLQQTGLNNVENKDKLLFVNRTGKQLTRAGVAYILKKYVEAARVEHPEMIPDKFSPHCMRHSKAMHLLHAGVAIIYIRDFLGHESVKTTEVYAKVDGKSKREALDAAYTAAIEDSNIPKSSWNDDNDLMAFLKKLCDN
ncbi:tyrosine-type recombinase/integrase [Ruminococcus albus]|uniref:Site-specific recombinase XerD n=1 Tax=Ruminococcus albus TaxID=1264 RepID=A0A1I1MDQ8_RUMAL|nr:tyrosine-type recombinase/integrase [Ruminococcus albus]SFC79780.1 Site-specific recombinase XerD [Ruminococcus albus]